MANVNYDYLENVKEDVRDYIDNEIDFTDYESMDDLEQDLNDKLFIEDSVTGNASGSYTSNCYKAEQYVKDNLDLAVEMAREFDCKDQFMDWLFNENYESIDVSIRCYLLTQAISEVLPEYTEEFIESHADLVEFEEE